MCFALCIYTQMYNTLGAHPTWFCQSWHKSLPLDLHTCDTVCIAKFWQGRNFGKFGKTNVTHQYFTQSNSRFTKVANVSYCKSGLANDVCFAKFAKFAKAFWNPAKILQYIRYHMYANPEANSYDCCFVSDVRCIAREQ